MGGILAGPVLVLRALGFFGRRPGLIGPALLPSLVALAVSAAGVAAVSAWGGDLLARLWAQPEGAGGLLWWFASVLARLILALGVLLVTPWLVMLVGFPLCEPLVGRVRAALGAKDEEAGFWQEILLSLTGSLGVIAVGLAGTIALLLLGLVPGLGVITVPLATFVWTPLFLAYDLYDPALSRQQKTFKQKVAFVRSHLLAAVSLGLTAAPLVAVPILNLLGLPLVVVAGVLAVDDARRANRLG